MVAKRNWKMSNSGTIASGDLFYPFTESGAPDDYDLRNHFPLKNFKIENRSSQKIQVILDPVADGGTITFDVPDGKTLQSLPEEDWTFYQVAIKNEGDLDISSADLVTLELRNY